MNLRITKPLKKVRFWTLNSPTSMVLINSTFIGKKQNYLHHEPPKLQNAINEIQSMVKYNLHHSKRISSNFDEGIPLIKEKFMKADYPLRFINSVINEFQKGEECGDESFIIPASLFEIAKPFIFVEIPFL